MEKHLIYITLSLTFLSMLKTLEAGSVEVYTYEGVRCVFPFTYDGRTFTSCTTYQEILIPHIPWCGLVSDVPLGGTYLVNWGNCMIFTFPAGTSTADECTLCRFPFWYNAVHRYKCTQSNTEIEGVAWCMTIDDKWAYCLEEGMESNTACYPPLASTRRTTEVTLLPQNQVDVMTTITSVEHLAGAEIAMNTEGMTSTSGNSLAYTENINEADTMVNTGDLTELNTDLSISTQHPRELTSLLSTDHLIYSNSDPRTEVSVSREINTDSSTLPEMRRQTSIDQLTTMDLPRDTNAISPASLEMLRRTSSNSRATIGRTSYTSTDTIIATEQLTEISRDSMLEFNALTPARQLPETTTYNAVQTHDPEIHNSAVEEVTRYSSELMSTQLRGFGSTGFTLSEQLLTTSLVSHHAGLEQSRDTEQEQAVCIVHVWLNIAIQRLYISTESTRVIYECREHHYFHDQALQKDATCLHSNPAIWTPHFEDCIPESVVLQDKEFRTPVEAKHSVAVGSTAIILVTAEAVLIIVMDAQHIVEFMKGNNCLHKQHKKKKRMRTKFGL